MHKLRRASSTSCESRFLNRATISLTAIKRRISSPEYEKSYQKADRLLLNKHIVNKQLPIYRAIYKQHGNASSRPIIPIVWSDLIVGHVFDRLVWNIPIFVYP
jgi:hypothetical protein